MTSSSAMPGANGATCANNGDCASNHCTQDFDGMGNVCAAAGTCPNGATGHPSGYVECAASGTYSRLCSAAGNWDPVVNNPQPQPAYCTPGGLPFGGIAPAATCTPGVGGGFASPCMSCEPYFALSTTACNTTCPSDDNARCWTAYHCYSGDSRCYPDASGANSLCDNNGECTSGRCSMGRCQDKLPNGSTGCMVGNDCVNGTCSNGVCCGGGACCTAANASVCGSFTCNTATNSCYTSCATNDDSKCQSTSYHCLGADNVCYANIPGAPCDNPLDCAGGACTNNTCAITTIGRIMVSCTNPGGGGGGPFRYGRVDVNGLPLMDVSSSATVALYQTFNNPQNLTLTTAIQPGWYFAVLGGEGSGALTCTFQFFTPANSSLGSSVVTTTGGGTDRIVRSGTGAGDIYTRFFWDGVVVTFSEQTTP